MTTCFVWLCEEDGEIADAPAAKASPLRCRNQPVLLGLPQFVLPCCSRHQTFQHMPAGLQEQPEMLQPHPQARPSAAVQVACNVPGASQARGCVAMMTAWLAAEQLSSLAKCVQRESWATSSAGLPAAAWAHDRSSAATACAGTCTQTQVR